MPKLNAPKISVVLPVYNGEKYIKKAISSILSQTLKDFELIIVDDASTDKSIELIKKFNDKRIKVISNKINKGISASINEGVLLAKSSLIARMDQDDISFPSRLASQYKFLKDNNFDLIGSWYQNIDRHDRVVKKVCRLTSSSELKKSLLVDNYICHGSTMFKKQSWKKAGKYCSSMDYAEDYDFFSRVALLSNLKIGKLSEVLYSQRINPEGMSSKRSDLQQKMRDKISKRNLRQWQLFYSFGYNVQPENRFELSSQRQISKSLSWKLFRRGSFIPAISELLFYLRSYII